MEYRDFDFAFNTNPVTGDLVTHKDVKAVMRSLRHLFLIGGEEMVMRNDIDCNLRDMLFQLQDPITKIRTKTAIREAIIKHEPRIELKDVEISQPAGQPHSCIIRVLFTFANDETVIYQIAS